MAWTTEGRNRRADATAALIVNCSLHTGDPGGSGSNNEWSGSGYSRLSPSFASASGGVASLSANMVFNGPEGTQAAYMGFWGSGGAFLGSVIRSSGDAAVDANDEYTVDQLNVTAQGDIS